MKNVNQPRKYVRIKWAGGDKNENVLGTALHVAVDRWNEAQGCTLKTGGEQDLIRANYELEHQKRENRRDRYITKKREALNSTLKKEPAPIGTQDNG